MSTSRWVAAAALIACWTAGVTTQQARTLTATDIAAVKKEVTDAVETYYRLFTAQDMKALPEHVYNIPWILMTGNGPQPDLTVEQARARFDASLKQLVDSGWGKSVFTTTGVCVLNS